ncbi:hypothetical protein EG329_004275 [Mollisiaceae sp. DMI_Dod_QoI]|nr:hypothetical protein EG329_004275 [Helotiales sp. DMI_Dod_QoI]
MFSPLREEFFIGKGKGKEIADQLADQLGSLDLNATSAIGATDTMDNTDAGLDTGLVRGLGNGRSTTEERDMIILRRIRKVANTCKPLSGTILDSAEQGIVDVAPGSSRGGEGSSRVGHSGNGLRREVRRTSSHSVAGAGLQHLQQQFSGSDFDYLQKKLRVIAEEFAVLEDGQAAEIQALNGQIFSLRAENGNLRHREGVYEEVVRKADRRIDDLSKALSEVQDNDSRLAKCVQELGDLRVEKALREIQIEAAIRVMKEMTVGGGDQAKLDQAIRTLQSKVGEVPVAAKATVEDAFEDGNN